MLFRDNALFNVPSSPIQWVTLSHKASRQWQWHVCAQAELWVGCLMWGSRTALGGRWSLVCMCAHAGKHGRGRVRVNLWLSVTRRCLKGPSVETTSTDTSQVSIPGRHSNSLTGIIWVMTDKINVSASEGNCGQRALSGFCIPQTWSTAGNLITGWEQKWNMSHCSRWNYQTAINAPHQRCEINASGTVLH